MRDRKKWVSWLFEAKKRFGLIVFNHTVTSNHIHLLVRDPGEDTIPKAMQLIAGKVAQQYNHRKGAFRENRYHATAVDTGEHLFRCLVYIDMNRVRTGVVQHPYDWATSGYPELQKPRERYGIIDHDHLAQALTFNNVDAFREQHRQWATDALQENMFNVNRNGLKASLLVVRPLSFKWLMQSILNSASASRQQLENRLW